MARTTTRAQAKRANNAERERQRDLEAERARVHDADEQRRARQATEEQERATRDARRAESVREYDALLADGRALSQVLSEDVQRQAVRVRLIDQKRGEAISARRRNPSALHAVLDRRLGLGPADSLFADWLSDNLAREEPHTLPVAVLEQAMLEALPQIGPKLHETVDRVIARNDYPFERRDNDELVAESTRLSEELAAAKEELARRERDYQALTAAIRAADIEGDTAPLTEILKRKGTR